MNHSYMWHDSWAVLCWRFQCFRFVWASLRREGYWIPTKTCNSGRLHNHYQICDMTHSYVWHDSFICVTWLIHIWDMTYSYVWHDSFIRVTWLIHMCDMTHWNMWHDSFICATWLIYMCDMTHLCVRYDSFIYESWMSRICDIYVAYIWDMIHICVTTHTHICIKRDMIHICIKRDMIHIYVTTGSCLFWCIYMRHDTYMCDDSYTYMYQKRHDPYMYQKRYDPYICDDCIISLLMHIYETWYIYGTYVCDDSFMVRYDSFIYEPWMSRIGDIYVAYIWDMTYICDDSFMVRYDSFIYVSCLFCVSNSYVWHDSFKCATFLKCATWLIDMCDMTHSNVRHDSFLVRYDSFIYVSCLFCVSGTSHSYVWYDSHTFVTWPFRMCDIIY